MSDKTGIEWTDATWNPTTGCDQVSPGCDHCYALSMAKRLKAMGQKDYQLDGAPATSGPGFGFQMHPHRLDQPLRWTRPRRIFVNSMSDLFHGDATGEFVAQVWAVMSMAPQHTFQVLTKRPQIARSLLTNGVFRLAVNAERLRRGVPVLPDSARADGTYAWPLPNVWLGTSTEDQQRADLRIPALLATPAAVRFLSMEPLLGPIDLRLDADMGNADPGIDWVIVGGESGKDARPMHPDWVRGLRDQSLDAGVPFHFKQWGEWAPGTYQNATHLIQTDGRAISRASGTTKDPYGHGSGVQDLVDRGHQGWARIRRPGKRAAGRELDGRTWDEFPQSVTA